MLIDLDVDPSCNPFVCISFVRGTLSTDILSTVHCAGTIVSREINQVYDTVEVEGRQPVVADCNFGSSSRVRRISRVVTSRSNKIAQVCSLCCSTLRFSDMAHHKIS